MSLYIYFLHFDLKVLVIMLCLSFLLVKKKCLYRFKATLRREMLPFKFLFHFHNLQYLFIYFQYFSLSYVVVNYSNPG